MSVCFELQQESENALAIKIREQVLDKISACKSEEELKRTIVKIIQDNDEQIDLEKIQESNEISRIADSLIACSIETNPDNLNQTQIQIGELLKNAIDLICNPPTFSIPYPFPVIDISGEFLKQLLLALLRLAIKILLSILKKLLSLVIDICNSGLSSLNSFGSKDIKNIIGDSISSEVNDSFIGDVFSAFGINTDGTAATLIIGEAIPCDEETAREAISNIKDINSFLDDLSFMATPVELCSLLNNKATEQTYAMVEELLQFEYPEMKKRLNNRVKIASLFKTLGSKSDPSICQIIEDNAEAIISQPELCFTGDANQVRENLLKNRNLTDDQIKNIINKERDRNKQNLEKLAELAAVIKTNPNKIFGEQQPIFCKGSTPGLVGLDAMPSLKQNISDAIDESFNNFASVFRRNTSTFIDSIITTTKDDTDQVVPKFISYLTFDVDGNSILVENSLNPEFTKLTSNGSYKLCDVDGNDSKNSLLNFYGDSDYKVNSQPIVRNDIIDIQTLINTSNYDAFESDDDDTGKVYIKKQDIRQSVLEENKLLFIALQTPVAESRFYSLDYDSLSVSYIIYNRSKDIITGKPISLPNTEEITIYTIGEENE